MINESNEIKKYEFNVNGFSYYIKINLTLTKEEHQVLNEILASFPHSSRSSEWWEKFYSLNFKSYPKKLLSIAANAYDGLGNTVLGIACEYGETVTAVQQLIDIGADLNLPDDKMRKLPLHWAINNRLSFFEKNSYPAVEVVKCLLINGARTDIICYDDCTPLQYAENRGYTAAVNLIKIYNEKGHIAYTRGAIIGLFSVLTRDVCSYLSLFLNKRDGKVAASVRKEAWNEAKREVRSLLQEEDTPKPKRLKIR